jgi:hypothetical protein
VGKKCDSGCAVTFTATKVAVTNGATAILTGQREKKSGLWRAPLENSISAQAAPGHYVQNVYEHESIKYTIIYLHICCFSSVQDTWLKAIQNGHFATWPSVTVENVREYLQKSDATAKYHMNQISKNIWSTQPAITEPTPESDMVQEDKCKFIYSAIMETNQICTDITGRFPTNYLSGNKLILILPGQLRILSESRNAFRGGRRRMYIMYKEKS